MLKLAQQVLYKEAQAILKTSEQLDESFVKIATTIANIKGNLLIIGVGKSAIIGKKISASFASLGIKSFFIHAAELIHGDLGNIDNNDICILISFSGKSEEILKIIPFLQDRKCTLFSISQANSPLSIFTQANINTNCNEAISNIPAPTTSTTLSLALGDALLALVIKLKDFQINDFAKNHPGGSLGKRYYEKVADLMHTTNLPLATTSINIKDAILIMSKCSFGCVVLCDNDELVGFFSDGDLRRAMQEEYFSFEKKALFYASTNPKCIDKNALAYEAFKKMKENKISVLCVVENKKVIGLLKLLDE